MRTQRQEWFCGHGSEQARPFLPEGWGALQVRFHFTSHVELYDGDFCLLERPNYDIWMPWPDVRLDGASVRASWSSWWYSLPAGDHDLIVTSPGEARLVVAIPASQTVHVGYEVATVFAKDDTDTRFLGSRSTGSLGLLDDAPDL